MTTILRFFVVVAALASLALPVQAGFVHPELSRSGAGLSDFVPAGWTVLEEAQGDLNGDSRVDTAAIIERNEAIEHVPGCDKWRDRSGRAPRTLIILLADAAGGFRLAAENRHIVFRSDEGGVFGDPFESLRVERGAVVLRHYGGSNWRWAYTHRFRLQDGRWVLIGYTSDAHTTISRYERQYDYNLLTGKVKITTTGQDGGIGCYRCFQGEPCPPSPSCEKDETRAPTREVWKALPNRPQITLDTAACVDILPYVPYE